MLKKAVAGGLAGLGIIGGAATVSYDDNGNATVAVTNPTSAHVEKLAHP